MDSTSIIVDCSNHFTDHLVAISYPGRGHINQLMNFCKLIVKQRSDLLITFVVTEEWLGFLSSEPEPGHNIRYATIPNIVPSEKHRAKAHKAFVEAVQKKMEAPVERLLDLLDPPKPKVIIYDSILTWVLGVAHRRVIQAASFWPLSATFFTIQYHFDSLLKNGQIPTNFTELRDRRLNFIPGVPSIRIADFPEQLIKNKSARDFVPLAVKADCLLITSIHELESEAMDSLKKELPCPVYAIGLSIPSFNNEYYNNDGDHISWLDAQPKASVLYISQGSFFSSSDEQLDELVAGVQNSGVRFFWIARENRERLLDGLGGSESCNGLVVTWCDQLKVLSHPSIGGFWSHCGWNSAKESAFSGVPVLTYPIALDQFTNSKQIVEDWKIGWRLNEDNDGRLVKREEISRVLKRFMDSECEEVEEMRRRAVEIGEICRKAVTSECDVEAFIQEICG